AAGDARRRAVRPRRGLRRRRHRGLSRAGSHRVPQAPAEPASRGGQGRVRGRGAREHAEPSVEPVEPPGAPELAAAVRVGRAQGLYLVEAIIGAYRGTTLVFASDTVALTKVSAGELLVWTVDRRTGRAVGGVDVAWTDGLGTLQSATTGADGVAVFRHASPERTYVIGRDGDGGVFVSENFYYDSEIYDTKLYAVTDRPLYRPGDTVHVKVL